MTEIEVVQSENYVVPGTGEVIDLSDEVACVAALEDVREFRRQVDSALAVLTVAIVERSRVLGSKTIQLPDGKKATIGGGTATVYDAIAVEEGLRALEMPEERIREIVEETVSYRVKAVEAKRAAGANEEYAKVIESASTEVDKAFYVSVRRS